MRVYVVWMPMLSPDARAAVDTGLIIDPRVTQFWDDKRVAGRWFADAGVGGESYGGIAWDAYYLFGPDASWNDKPAPLAGFGAPVISSTRSLRAELRPFL